MAYCAQSDLEDVFGKDSIAVWSRLDDAEGADTARIAKAILYATAWINGRFRNSYYQVPLIIFDNETIQMIATWAAVVAGMWLFNSRPGYARDKENEDEIKGFYQQKKSVEREIDRAVSGYLTLNCQRGQTIRGGGAAVVIDKETFNTYPYANPGRIL